MMTVAPESLYAVAAVSCGRDHTLALLDGGRVMGWGGDGSGRLLAESPGLCTAWGAPTRPVEVRLQSKLASIAAGYSVSLGVDERGEIAIWGACAAGIGGHSESIALADPQPLPGVPNARAVAAGEFQFAAIDREGVVHTWGLNTDGALGRASAQLNALPAAVAGLPPVNQVASGQGFMLALTRDGALYAWGNNGAGQLGLGRLGAVAVPEAVATPTQFTAVAAGATHALALSTGGKVFAWGSNQLGQLGTGDARPTRSVPQPVVLPEPVKAVAAGMHYSLALSVAGNVYAWGWNGFGQLGHGDTDDRRRPERIAALARVRSIAAGQAHAIALAADRTLRMGQQCRRADRCRRSRAARSRFPSLP